MSLPLPQETSTPAPQPSLDSARKAHLSTRLRATLDLFRRLFVIGLRRVFSLPSDKARDEQIDTALRSLFTNQQNLLKSLNELIGVSNQLQRRVAYYEEHIPRMRELKIHFNQEEAGLREKSGNGHGHGLIHKLEIVKR